MAKTSKRLTAFIIDILVTSTILSIFNMFFLDNKAISILNSKFNDINELVLNKTIKFNDYMINFADIVKGLSEEYLFSMIFSIIISFIYFVLIPYYKNGQTLGLNIMKIKIASIEDEEIRIPSLLIRSVIINGILYNYIVLILLYIMPSMSYFISVSILGIMQLLLVIASIFMVLYKRDKKGLQDILSKSVVVDINVEVIE